MSREQKLALFVLLGIFAVIVILLSWQSIFRWQSFFMGGTKPAFLTDIQEVKPTLPTIRASDPRRGSTDKNAIQIVEFADFNCLHCRLMETELDTILTNKELPVTLIWRDFPLSDDPAALAPSIAGRCAHAQGKFWQMHDALMKETQPSDAVIKRIAQAVGLDLNRFNACLINPKTLKSLQADIDAAKAFNITSTPTLFVGNDVVEGYTGAAELEVMIRQKMPTK